MRDLEYLTSLLLEIIEVSSFVNHILMISIKAFVSEPVSSRKMIDLKQKLLYNQDRINKIRSNTLYPGGIRAEDMGNDLIFTNLRESFAPFTQPCTIFTSLLINSRNN